LLLVLLPKGRQQSLAENCVPRSTRRGVEYQRAVCLIRLERHTHISRGLLQRYVDPGHCSASDVSGSSKDKRNDGQTLTRTWCNALGSEMRRAPLYVVSRSASSLATMNIRERTPRNVPRLHTRPEISGIKIRKDGSVKV
jgi:hypothetical protein